MPVSTPEQTNAITPHLVHTLTIGDFEILTAFTNNSSERENLFQLLVQVTAKLITKGYFNIIDFEHFLNRTYPSANEVIKELEK